MSFSSRYTDEDFSIRAQEISSPVQDSQMNDFDRNTGQEEDANNGQELDSQGRVMDTVNDSQNKKSAAETEHSPISKVRILKIGDRRDLKRKRHSDEREEAESLQNTVPRVVGTPGRSLLNAISKGLESIGSAIERVSNSRVRTHQPQPEIISLEECGDSLARLQSASCGTEQPWNVLQIDNYALSRRTNGNYAAKSTAIIDVENDLEGQMGRPRKIKPSPDFSKEEMKVFQSTDSPNESRIMLHDESFNKALSLKRKKVIIEKRIKAINPKQSFDCGPPKEKKPRKLVKKNGVNVADGPMGTTNRDATTPESRPLIVLRACQARIKKGMVRGAIELCHHVLIQWHNDALKILVKNIQSKSGTDHLTVYQLLCLRNDIAGIWCTYARVILEVARFLDGRMKKQISKSVDDPALQTFLPSREQCEKLHVALVGEALRTLRNAQTCPLVGNHGHVTINLSRVLEFDFCRAQLGNYFERSSEMLSTDEILSTYFSLDFQLTRDLATSFQNLCGPDFMFAGTYSESIIKEKLHEITTTGTREETGKRRINIKAIDRVKLISQCLSELPEFSPKPSPELEFLFSKVLKMGDDHFFRERTPTLATLDFEERESRPSSLGFKELDFHDSSNEHFRGERPRRPSAICLPCTDEKKRENKDKILSEMEMVNELKDAREKFRVQAKSKAVSTEFCAAYADFEELDLNNGRGTKVYSVEVFDTIRQCWENTKEKPFSLSKASAITDRGNEYGLADMVTDVEQICTNCLVCAFSSLPDFKAHNRECFKRIKTQKSAIAFGKSLISRKWNLSSFDPENGRGRQMDDVLNVLDYSVEMFEVKPGHWTYPIEDLEQEHFPMFAPSFSGQIGLRCQYCVDKDGWSRDGSFIFPYARKNLPQAMWHLCIGHLDDCPNQPVDVKTHHQEYRERVAHDSGVLTEYWNNAAEELGLQPRRGNVGLVWRTVVGK